MSCSLSYGGPGPHYRGPAEDLEHEGWDMVIVPRVRAVGSVVGHTPAWAPCVAIEGRPWGWLRRLLGPPSEVVQPWEHGDPWAGPVGLWLWGLPLVTPTAIVEPLSYRGKASPGLAEAMADQWPGEDLTLYREDPADRVPLGLSCPL